MASQLRRGRRVGIDYGDVRVGIAVTDLEAILVSPLTTLINDQDLFQNLLNIITDNQPIYIALGSPVHLSGDVSSKSKAVNDFAEKLKSVTDTDIYLIDERLTTKSAQNQLRDVGIEGKKSKSIIDQMAAVNILNQALLLETSPKGLGEKI
jgi:putative Holliday junction resolvase